MVCNNVYLKTNKQTKTVTGLFPIPIVTPIVTDVEVKALLKD